MAVEAQESTDRQIVPITWDQEAVTGEVVQLHCVNPENGDVSVSGLSKNDGQGYVTYPPGYSGATYVTVYDNDGNSDSGMITVGDAEPPEIWGPDDPRPTPPIEMPPEGGEGGEGGEGEPPGTWGGAGEPFPTPPIEIPELPEIPDGIWGPPDGRPTPPIVIHPDPGDDFWTGNLPPAAQPVEE